LIRISKRLEFDAGHRIPDHNSVCRNLHGHRYALEVTVEGEVRRTRGASDEGMVMDFAAIKAIAQRHVADPWDHAFLVCERDTELLQFLRSIAGHKTVVLHEVPTAENLARIAFEIVSPQVAAHYGGGVRLAAVRLYETPNSWADYSGGG
jgi:6-pyruvoyltetrahydropterin/6-carboxytetrahydropterin synthase